MGQHTAGTPLKSPDNPRLLDFKGDVLTVRADGPLPPGSRVAFELKLDETRTIPIAGKIVSTAPRSDGFALVIRQTGLSREHRTALIDAVSC